ncbi:MAG TPA: ABC transporter permease [Vicinamibacterales bacterium]|jgi:predicted permease|nr:ABC transporter permease [Vicinamibacterales bacterium]
MRNWAPHVRSRLSSLRLSPAREHEIVEELSQHLEDRWRELVAGGTPEDVATRLALAEFRDGNLLARHMAPLRQAQVPPAVTPGAPAGQGLQGVAQDVRYALRTLRRQPAFSLTAILTLALGIGATTAMFSVVNGVVIKPLAYPESENVVTVGVSAVFGTERNTSFPLAPRMFASYAENGRSFQELGLFNTVEATVTGLGNPEHTNVLQVTRGVLTALRVQPVLGRWFSPDDDRPGTPETVILSHGYWQRRFGGDPGIIGRAITIASRPREVIGVMPASFSLRGAPAALIVPFRFDPNQPPAGFCCLGVARLKPGATLGQANADVARMVDVWKRLENRPQLDALQLGPAVRPLKDDVVGDGVRRVLWIVLGTIGIVLLIACANVANLLLVRAEGRRQELAIRTALGAGWRHVARLLMIESLTLGLLGGVIGLALAYGGLRALLVLAPENLPRLNEITIDTSVVVVTAAISTASGFLFGLVPLARIVRPTSAPSLAEFLRGGGRSASAGRSQRRSQNALVVVQVALALVLLFSSGLMIRTFQNMRSVQPGFTDPATVQSVRILVPELDVPEPERVTRVQQSILDRLAAIPGVTSAAFVDQVPMEPFRYTAPVAAEGQNYGPNRIPPTRTIRLLSPGALRTLGTPLLVGRDFTWEELHNQRNVAMVSESFARTEWSTVEGAVGKRVRVGTSQTWQEVIGVVAEVYDDGANKPAPPIVYWPARSQDYVGGTLLPRSVNFSMRSDRAGTEAFVRDIRQAVAEVMPGLPVFQIRTLREVYDLSMAGTAFSLVMLSIAGSMALLLGAVGIYGVLAYAAMQCQREVGIRLALGAQPGTVKGMFVYRGLMLAGIGIAIGAVVAAGATRSMSSLLFGVTPVDTATLAAAASVLVMAALAASYIPARRAAALDPVHTLTAAQ